MRVFTILVLFVGPLLAACTSRPAREPAGLNPARTALWDNVRLQCLQKQTPAGQPDSCLQTNLSQGYILYRDLKSQFHDLIIPSKPVTGIEDPQILAPDAPNYFAQAWNGFVDIGATAQKPVPRDLIGADINPVFQRSQDQLHIHVACLWPDVAQALRQHQSEFSDWEHSTINLRGRDYRVLVLHQAQLGTTNPFRLLANDLKPGDEPMGHHTLLLVGARFPDATEGFLLLDRSGPPTDPTAVHAEDLQDNACSVLNSTAAGG